MSTPADCPGAPHTARNLALLLLAGTLLAASSVWLSGCAGLIDEKKKKSISSLTISNPGSMNVAMTSAVADWQTNVPATSQVEYGTTTSYGSATAADSTMVTIHQQSLSSLKPGTLYHFRVHSTDANNNSVASSDLSLTTTTAVAPTITTQPGNQTVVAGQTASFTVVAAGTAPLSYQWQRNGASIAGATAASYTTPATTTADSGSSFAVAVSNTAGTVTSSAALLTVNATAVAPTITTQPGNQTVVAGQTASFTVVAAGTAPLGYQWQKNGASIAGATAASYTTPATTTADSGSSFAVVVSNTAGTVTSSAATLTVNAAAVAPTITTQPGNQTVVAGQAASFTVVAGGTAPLGYQWQKNGASIAGATAASYTTPATTTADSGATFRVVVTNTAGTVTSSAATLTVNPAPVAPTVTTQPVNQTVTAGQAASFTVVVGGTAPLSYQWQKNSVNVTAGATSSTYTTPTTTTADTGSTFAVVVSNTAGTVTSSAATLTVNADTTAPTVPAGLSATAASSSQINLLWTASTDNVGVTGYNVYRGGTKVGTSTTTSFSDTGLTASTTYSYTVAAFDAASNTSAQSASASATTLSGSGGGGQIPNTLGWYQIPNTSIQALCPPYSDIQGMTGCPAVMSTWSGGLFDPKRNRLIIHGGGHNDYYGNEIYAVDLNANPIARLLVKDASHGTAISNLSTCPEAYTDGNPSARHSYAGEIYLPTQDLYMTFSGSKSNCGFMSNGLWYFDPSGLSWTQVAVSGAAPNPGQNGSLPIIAYDPTSGGVYEVESNAGTFWKYDPAAKLWTSLANTGACGLLNMSAAIDYGRRLYLCAGNGGFYKVSLNPPYTATQLAGANCGTLAGTSAPGFAYDPVQKLMVGWAGGNTAYLYNPDTDSCTTATYSGGPTTIQGNGTYGRFAYSPALNVFVVVNDISQNVYSLRLTPASGTGGGTGPAISGVAASGITTSGATIAWTTDVTSTSQVEYGTTTSYGTLTTLNSSLVTSHSVALTGLSAGTLYHYRVHSKNASGVESISGDFAFQTNNTTDTIPPTVSITAPAAGATVSGTVTVSANATDNVGVTSVQFLLDGANLGSAVTSIPYSISWNTTTATNAAHSLGAQARDAAGNVGNAVGVSVTVSNSTSGALQDFQTRCADPGVLVCQGFDSASVVIPGTNGGTGLNPGDTTVNGTNFLGTFDPTVAASGGGSLMFTIPSFAGSNPSGNWEQLIGKNFGARSTFYVQFRQRFSPEFLTNQWPASGGGTTYWKQEIFSNHGATCANVELSTVNTYNKGFPLMYSQCGQDVFEVSLGNGDYLLEQGDTSTTGYNCHYQNPTPTTCFMYPANTWVTFYWKVSIGDWGQPNSTIQAWAALPGQPYGEWVNIQNHTLFEDTVGKDYDSVWLLPYMTNRTSSVSAGPTAYTWYDELIVSTNAIPVPKF